jgi:hypothetical protein
VLATLQEVIIHHDTLDYASVFAGVAGGLAAIVALIFALLSKRDAQRSADAAEAALAIMRREAQRRANPDVQLSVHALGTSPEHPPGLVVLTLGFSNDGGTRAAERLTVNFLVAERLTLMPCDDEYGNGSGHGKIMLSPNEQLGDVVGVKFWANDVGPIDPNVHRPAYLRIGGPPPGEHRLRAKLTHEDLPDGHREHEWVLQIPETGQAIELLPQDA